MSYRYVSHNQTISILGIVAHIYHSAKKILIQHDESKFRMALFKSSSDSKLKNFLESLKISQLFMYYNFTYSCWDIFSYDDKCCIISHQD